MLQLGRILKLPFGSRLQAGFSIVETMISFALLGISIAAYFKFHASTAEVSKTMSERQDVIALRQFLQAQFSCEKTLEKASVRVNNKLVAVNCPFSGRGVSIDILNADKAILMPEGGGVFGDYKVIGTCDGNSTVPDTQLVVQTPSFRFFAHPLKGKQPDEIPFYEDRMRNKLNGWYDVLDGNELQCALPDDPGPPIDRTCTAMFVTNPGEMPTGEVSGPYFRTNGRDTWAHRGNLQASLLIRAFRDGEAPDPSKGMPSKWIMKYMNKNPSQTIGTGASNTLLGNGMEPPVPSDPFEVPAAMTLKTVPGMNVNECSPQTQVNEAVPKRNVQPGCSYFEQRIEFSQMRNPSNWYAAPLDILIVGVDASGNTITECNTKINLVSPLVFMWPAPSDAPHELDFYPVGTRFDLRAEGRPLNTGWVSGNAAFLAIDLNKNGKIDDGSELFGDASQPRADGSPKAENGFVALAAYDDNHDGFIDAKDPVFSQLKLWFDEDSDGQSQPWELQTLEAFEVTKIGLGYKPVEKQPTQANMLTNFVYESRFYGPGVCGSEGCKVYDIYFTMDHSQL